MRSNISLFTWEEKFLLYQTLKKRKIEFEKKYWKENIFEFKSDDINIDEIMNVVFWWGLFSTKKMLIIYWLPKDTYPENKISESKYKTFEEKIINNFNNISEDVILIFVSFVPDKRTKWYKFFSTNCVVKQFDKLKTKDLKLFINNLLINKMNDSDLDYFLWKIWDDMFAINNEIMKLKIYSEHKNISINKELIDFLVYDQFDINAFDILDNMITDKNKTLKILNDMQNKWEDEFKFLWMIYRWLKLFLQLIDFNDKWENSSKELASKLWVPPFAILKHIKNIKTLSSNKNKLIGIYKNVVNLDYWIKIWKIPQDIFWLEIKRIIFL